MTEFIAGWLLPLIYATGCVLAFGQAQRHGTTAWITASAALAATVGATLVALLRSQWQPLTVDVLGLTVALSVAVLGWVIINYSSRYLNGEPGQTRFVRAMLFTLSVVGLLLVSRHLAVMEAPTPLRLTVVIDAPREAIDTVIAKHAMVQQLLHNRWLYLTRLDGEQMERYWNGSWQAWTA